MKAGRESEVQIFFFLAFLGSSLNLTARVDVSSVNGATARPAGEYPSQRSFASRICIGSSELASSGFSPLAHQVFADFGQTVSHKRPTIGSRIPFVQRLAYVRQCQEFTKRRFYPPVLAAAKN
jgi:hypothetical protein